MLASNSAKPLGFPLDLTAEFSRFRDADPDRLHFAAHSHAYWPDVTRDAQLEVWDDAARLVDEKTWRWFDSLLEAEGMPRPGWAREVASC